MSKTDIIIEKNPPKFPKIRKEEEYFSNLSLCSRAGSENDCGDIMRAKLALIGSGAL